MANANVKIWASEAFWVAFGLGASVFAMLAGTRFLTTLLSVEEYGKLALAMSLTTLVVQVGATPISQTAIRFYAHWKDEGKLPTLLRSVGSNIGLVLVLVAIITLSMAFLNRWSDVLPGTGFILIVGVLAILLVINRVAFALEDASRERRMRALFQGFFELGRFSLAAGLILIFANKSAEIALVGFVLAGILVVTAHACFLRRKTATVLSTQNRQVNKTCVGADRKTILHFLQPLILCYACTWVVMMTERWVLQYFGSLADVGGYTAVYQLAFMPMTFFSSFLLLLTAPIIYQHIGSDSNTEKTIQALLVNRYFAYLILVFTLVGVLLLSYFHPLVGRLLLGPDFRSYSWLFPWLLLAGGCFAAAQQLLLKLTCEFRTWTLALLWGALAVIAVVSYIVSARLWQLNGLFVSVIGVNGLLLLLALILSYRVRENDL